MPKRLRNSYRVINMAEKEKGKLIAADTDLDVDLMICTENLIKLEEHYMNSYEQTGDETYLIFAHEVRMDRGKLLSILLRDLLGEEIFEKHLETLKQDDSWCSFKHHLTNHYGLREVAIKYVAESVKAKNEGNEEKAKKMMDKAKQIMEVAINERLRFMLLIEYLKKKAKESTK